MNAAASAIFSRLKISLHEKRKIANDEIIKASLKFMLNDFRPLIRFPPKLIRKLRATEIKLTLFTPKTIVMTPIFETRRKFRGIVFGFLVLLQTLSMNSFAQSDTAKPAGAWRVEVEPSAFIGRGYSVLASRAVCAKRNLSLGLYFFSIQLPTKMNARIFDHVDDSSTVHLSFELAASARYHFSWNGRASGPYVGLFLGYETFKITRPSRADLNTTNMFCTPQIGYEFYYYRKLLYINPSIRTVFEFSKTTDDAARLEEIKDFVLLPSISLGVRF